MAEPVTPVAIVGFGGRFPGKATDPLKLWEMCSEGQDAWTEIPSTRFNHEAFYHPDQSRNGATNVKGGFYLKEDVAYFDAPFFGMTKTEAASLDPQQRLLLECSYEALENSGIPLAQVSGSDMGVFVGSFCFDWAKITLRDPDAIPLYHATGTGQAMLANRLSYFFNLHGPSVTIDTACSSSLVAFHQACQALRAGECSTALVAGVNCTLCQDSLASMSTMGFLSPDGRSFTYDSRANGYGRGEGVACIVLKRLDLAINDGDAVRAVVRNTGVNQDGRTPGITFPSGEAQAALIRRVYEQAGLDLAETSYVEAHGTGTQAGDPIEARALYETFGACYGDFRRNQAPLVVGCIKTNIGHLEGASGAAGLIKTAMMLERETLLPNVGFLQPNSRIPLDEWHIEVPTSLRSWREATNLPVLRASVNGFGYGGTNAHVIVESAADYFKARSLSSGLYTFHYGHPLHSSVPGYDGDSGSNSNDYDSANDSPQSMPSTPLSSRHSIAISPTLGTSPSFSSPLSATKLLGNSVFSWHTDGYKNSSTTKEDGLPLKLSLPLSRTLLLQEKLSVPKLFVLTAQDEASGKEQAARLQAYLEQDDPSVYHDADFLDSLAYTLGSRRSALPWKVAVPASSAGGLRDALGQVRFQNAPKPATVAFVFTGQGAQWFAMGRELATTYPVFRASLDRSAEILASSTLCADWSLHEELLNRDASTTRVNEPAVSQPLCTILQVALVDLLRSWGITPTAVVGHSSGEIGAAYAAGLLTQEAAVAAAYFRVPLNSSAADSCRGGMVAIACDEATTLSILDSLQSGKAVIACYNSPQSFTVSGDDAAIDELVEACKAKGIRHRKLVVGFAYHSHRMAAAAQGYRELLQANKTVLEAFQDPVVGKEGAVEMYSSVTGKRLEPGALTLDYWVENLVNPVRFTEALSALCYETKTGLSSTDPSFVRKPQVDVLIEVGPHAALTGPIRQILQSEAPLGKISILSVLRRGQDATETAQALACSLFERGIQLNLLTVNNSESSNHRLLVDLPPYPWNHQTAYWAEPRESIRYRQRDHPRHDLLGAPVRFGNPLEPRWRQWIRTAETPWVRDHRVQGLVVYPAAGYISMAIEAARQDALRKATAALTSSQDAVPEIDGYELRDVSLGQALVIPEGSEEVEAMISLRPLAESAMDNSTVWHEFFVYSCSSSATDTTPMGHPINDNWSEHCRGLIAVRWRQVEADGEHVFESVTDAAELKKEKARLDAENRILTLDACTQDVDLSALYEHCTNIGLEYGPTFTNLVAAKAGRSPSDSTSRIAGTVAIPDVASCMPAHYHSPIIVHPGTLDACLHGIMAFRDMLKAAIMPVFFGHIYIAAELGQAVAGDALGVYLGVRRDGFRNLDIDLTAYGPSAAKQNPRDAAVPPPLIRMEGLRMTSLAGNMPSGPGGSAEGQPPKTYFQSEWRPDPAFLTSEQFDELCAHLMPPPEESAALRRLDQCAFYMADYALSHISEEAVPGLTTKGQKLYKSLQRQRDSVLAVQKRRLEEQQQEGIVSISDAPLSPANADDIATWPNASADERAALLEELKQTGAEGRLLAAVSANMHRIVLGDADSLEVTMKDDVLGQYYAHNPRMARQYQQAAVYVDLLAHKNPHMRILEIGAGTGGATLPLLRALGGDSSDGTNSLARFLSYDVTDISTGFFEAVREKTKPWSHLLNFRRLDIERDPSQQGFAGCGSGSGGTYDLVVAANVLHATRNIARTVAHARQLLRPGGTLLLIELVRVPQQLVSTAAVANIFGIFDGWWVAEEEHRQDSPLLAESQWDEVLRSQGFSGLDAAVWETLDVATHQGTTMVSTAVAQRKSIRDSVVNAKVDDDATVAETQGAVKPTENVEAADVGSLALETSPVKQLPRAVFVTDAPSNKPWLQKLAEALSTSDSSDDSLTLKVYAMEEEFPVIEEGQVCVFYQTEPTTLGPQTPESMEKMRRLFLRPTGSGGGSVLWLTRGASDGENVPDFALVKGLLRTLRVELGGRLVHLDLELNTTTAKDVNDGYASIKTIKRVFERSFDSSSRSVIHGSENDAVASEVELELAERGNKGTLHIPRYAESEQTSDYVASRIGRRHIIPAPAVQPGRHLKLEVAQPGLLDSLYFDDDPRMLAGTDSLPDDQIEISVQAAGLNFHDVMVAMGQIETRDLGRECAGIVSRVGAKVSSVQVGDRVAAPADGTFATTVRCEAWRAQRVPDSLNFEEAASLPIIFCTALHALSVTNLAAGETVLIHAASGGLGQALVQLCQHRGAIVYATVGTPEKKRFLVEQYGIPAGHIFSSRDDSFAEGVMLATKGRGVDVVFNVLAAELLRASWRCVAAFGRFVELGKRDLSRHGRIDLAPLARNATLVAVDLVALLAERPVYGARLWADSMELVRRGVARPPTPLAAHGYADAVAALRTLQAGRHIGKLVLVPQAQPVTTRSTTTRTETVTAGTTTTTQTTRTTSTEVSPAPAPVAARVMTPCVPPVRLRADDGSYLLVGGLGGIGRALAARMVGELGARYLIILSRGGITNDAAAAAVDRLRAAGAHVQVSNCDVGHADQLAAALAAAKDAGFPPVRGVVHLGLVMESALFQDMSSEAWNNSLWPKVAGTWDLHNQLMLSGTDVDFFVLLSSMVGIIGNPSQAAYGAASAFQDAFARYRRRRGLAASTLDLGMITGIGYVAEHGTVQHTLRSQGFEEIDGPECLALIEAAMLSRKPEAASDTTNWAPAAHVVTGLGLGRYTGGDPGRAIYQDARFALARRMALRTGSEDDATAVSSSPDAPQTIREKLRQASSSADVAGILESSIRAKITALLMLPSEDEIDPQKPLSQYGLDSLIAVELRNWVSSEMEATVPVLEFLGSRNIKSLSGFIARQSRLVRAELVAE